MLVDILAEKKTISYQGCMTQIFFFHFLGGGTLLFLSVMAYPQERVKVLVAQSCLTLCDPMDCSMPGFHVHHQLLEPTQTQAESASLQLALPLLPGQLL